MSEIEPVVPIGVTTLTVVVPTTRVQVALTLVDVELLTAQESLRFPKVMPVAPARFVPVSVSETPVP